MRHRATWPAAGAGLDLGRMPLRSGEGHSGEGPLVRAWNAGPLVMARGRGALGASDVVALTDRIDEQLARRSRFLVVVDATAVTGVDAGARKHFGEHRSRHANAAASLDLGLVLAVRSPVVRGALTAIAWVGGSFANLRAVQSATESVRVARAVLVEAGIELPAAVQSELERFAAL